MFFVKNLCIHMEPSGTNTTKLNKTDSTSNQILRKHGCILDQVCLAIAIFIKKTRSNGDNQKHNKQ